MKIFVAGGGTAGHIEPALAVARLWRERSPKDQIEFLGTIHGLENNLVPAAGFKLSLIPKVVAPRRITSSLFLSPFKLTSAFLQARAALKGADLLVGFGGYVCAPAYLAARSLNINFVIHEANAKAGLANRLGAIFTRYLAVAQPIAKGKLSRAQVTGLPLRKDVAQGLLNSVKDWRAARSSAKTAFGFPSDSKVVLIFFGSQGSVFLNKIIAQSLPTFFAAKVEVLHALGRGNQLPPAQPGYKPVSYIEDMATAYLAADLIIGRSGAVTCSEVNALGRYALLIPLAIGNGEQRVNANLLVAQKRAEVIEQNQFTTQWLKNELPSVLARADRTLDQGDSSDLLAAQKIVELMESALKERRSN